MMTARRCVVVLVALLALNNSDPAHAQRIRRRMLRELPPDVPCAAVPESCTRVRDVFGYDRVRRIRPDEATQEKITTQYEVPDDLRAIVDSEKFRDRLGIPPHFAELTLATAKKEYRYTEADIAELSPCDAVRLAAQVAHCLITYTREYTRDWPVSTSKILEAGKGDCKRYARLTAAAFQVLKDRNPYLKNTYVVDWPHFVPLWNHAFNTCVIVRADEIQVFYRDAIPSPSFCPGSWHVPGKLWKAMLLLDLGDEEAFRQEFARICPSLPRSEHCLLMYDLGIRLGSKKRYGEAVMLLKEASVHTDWLELKLYAYSGLVGYYANLGITRESKIYQYLAQQMDRNGSCTEHLVTCLRRYVWSVD